MQQLINVRHLVEVMEAHAKPPASSAESADNVFEFGGDSHVIINVNSTAL